MGDWSSFKRDKSLMDDWRNFLTEDKSPEKVEEFLGFGSRSSRQQRWSDIADIAPGDPSARKAAPAADKASAPADADKAAAATGKAMFAVTKTIRNIAQGNLVTPAQANHIQRLIYQHLAKLGYAQNQNIQEITATRQPYDAAPRRSPKGTTQRLAPLDIGSAGVAPENQAKVKNILDRLLASIGVEVVFGPNKPSPKLAKSSAAAAAAARSATPATAEGPVELFRGATPLYSKLFSSILARSRGIFPKGVEKADISHWVKQILKDLSDQLKANGMTVQENQVSLLSDLILEEMKSALIMEQQSSAPQSHEQNTRADTKKKYANLPTGMGGRVKPRKGEIDVSRAVHGKITALASGITPDDDPNELLGDKEVRRKQAAEVQPLSRELLRKIIMPHLQKYLQGKKIKLK